MGNGTSKAAFRDVLQELEGDDISLEDKAFWEKLWKTESNPHVRAARRYVLMGTGHGAAAV